jgi:hypothetical protein
LAHLMPKKWQLSSHTAKMEDRRILITATDAGLFHVQIFIGNAEKMSQYWGRDTFKNMFEKTQAMQKGMNSDPKVLGYFHLYIKAENQDDALLLDNDTAITQAILTFG